VSQRLITPPALPRAAASAAAWAYALLLGRAVVLPTDQGSVHARGDGRVCAWTRLSRCNLLSRGCLGQHSLRSGHARCGFGARWCHIGHIANLFGGLHAEEHFRGIEAPEEGRCAVAEHEIRHCFPLRAILVVPAFCLRHRHVDLREIEPLTGLQLYGPSNAFTAHALARHVEAKGREAFTGVDRGNDEGRTPGRTPLDDVEILRSHQGRAAN